jgi:hypothetical protein
MMDTLEVIAFMDTRIAEATEKAESEAKELREALNSLLCRVNRITSAYRHGHHRQSIPLHDLDNLCNFQIEVENMLNSQAEARAALREDDAGKGER